MELISCPKHNTSQICFIYFCDEKVKLLCDQCLDEHVKEKDFKLNQMLSIKKILMQPAYLLTILDWNDGLQKLLQDLTSQNKDKIQQQMNYLEDQIKYIQELMANLLNNFKIYAQKIQQYKSLLMSDMTKILDYDQLKMILEGLYESKEVINPDEIEQIQQQLNLYFVNIKKNNCEKIQMCFAKKIEEIKLKILEESKQLGKYELVNQKLEQFQKDQLILANLLFPSVQMHDLLQRSKIADSQYFIKLSSLIKDKMQQSKLSHKLIYLGSKDGLNAEAFWLKVNGKKNLLMIFKSESNYIFGAYSPYSPCQWQQNLANYAQDNTNSSFLFSQTHDEIYPIVNNQYAIYCYSGYGPTFGASDLYIGADFQNGHSSLGTTYKQGSKFQNQYTTQLFGQATPNVIECEIFEIIF